ncbi:hypothetical protein Dimus_003908, partial [Dionaea muscipula]
FEVSNLLGNVCRSVGINPVVPDVYKASMKPDESSQPPKAFETGESSDLPGRNPTELNGQEMQVIPGEIPQKEDACDETHSANQCHLSAVDFNAPPADGFKKAPNRRKKKKIASTDNPEHHQDKPEAMISS